MQPVRGFDACARGTPDALHPFMVVEELMSREVVTVSPRLDAEDAWQQMRASGVHHLVVMEEDELLGVISDRDLGGIRGVSTRWGNQVKDLMTHQLVTTTPRASVESAASLLRRNHIHCLPVFRRHRLVGIVTTTDLIAALDRRR
jgi:acetoin utilization protein AcuB